MGTIANIFLGFIRRRCAVSCGVFLQRVSDMEVRTRIEAHSGVNQLAGEGEVKKHINEFYKSRLANSGRIAGLGMLFDRYDEESGDKISRRTRTPIGLKSRKIDPEDMNGPVVIVEEKNDNKP